MMCANGEHGKITSAKKFQEFLNLVGTDGPGPPRDVLVWRAYSKSDQL
jgi:hypothetical protein